MALTRIDCELYRGDSASPDNSSYSIFNPLKLPGSLVAATALAARKGVGSQVGCRLALDHSGDGVLDFYEKPSANLGADPTIEPGLALLEYAFRHANDAVYNFGHKLAAGGRLAASFLALSIENTNAVLGRVGRGSGYLYRGKELFPFFAGESEGATELSTNYLGEHSAVSVALASVPVRAEDILLLFPFSLSRDAEVKLLRLLEKGKGDFQGLCGMLCQAVFPEPAALPFGITVQIGPEAIYLA